MSYRGFSIIHDVCVGWKVRVSIREEWLATSKEDAMRQVDDYYSSKECTKRNAA